MFFEVVMWGEGAQEVEKDQGERGGKSADEQKKGGGGGTGRFPLGVQVGLLN